MLEELDKIYAENSRKEQEEALKIKALEVNYNHGGAPGEFPK